MAFTVAVTGPTGEIGISAIESLEQHPEVGRIIGMARRPFDPSAQGWTKTEYRQGDILDRDAVDALVADADVVVHLAFMIMGSREESARVNLSGTRNVFEATVASPRPRRLVYTSSVAAYGYHSDNPVPITEEVPPRGSPEHYYSEQKAACEVALAEITTGTTLEVFVLRPCIVAGPKAPALAEAMPWNQLPAAVRKVVPGPAVAQAAVPRSWHASATRTPRRRRRRDRAWPQQLPQRRVLTTSRVTACCRCQTWPTALGARPVRVPRVAMAAASEALARLPFVPSSMEWLHVGRTSVVMDTSKAKSQLGWTPKYTAAETLSGLTEAV